MTQSIPKLRALARTAESDSRRRGIFAKTALAARHMRIEQLEARHLLAISPLPPLLPVVESLGTLTYRTTALDRLDATGQRDSFSLVLDANQLLSITARPLASEGLSPRLEIFNPFAQAIASDDASGPNAAALVQSQSLTAAGTYRIDVTSLAGGGDYELIVRTGAAVEEEAFGGAANDNIASAQSLSASSIALPGGAERLAVSGQFDGSGDDVFAFQMTAGQSAQLALARENPLPAFSSPEHVAVAGRPANVALGDMNGDGRLDIVTANEGQFPVTGEVSVVLQNADGTFAAAQTRAAGDQIFALKLGHFNADTHLDAVIASYDLDNVTVLFGAGDGTFTSTLDLAAGNGPIDLAVADLDDDGASDIVVTNALSSPGTVSILYGAGNGTFAPQTTVNVGDKPRGVAIADLNHDDHLDLIVTNEDAVTTDDAVAVLLGNGSRGFSAPTAFATGIGPRRVATADVNNDGHIDVVTANPGQSTSFPAASGNTLSILLGNGMGGFTTRRDVRAQIGPTTLSLADVNQDGDIDIVTNVYGRGANGEAVMVLPGRGDGTFASDPDRLYQAGRRPVAMVVGDIDSDGDLDIISTESDYPAYGVSILRGSSGPRLEVLDGAGVVVGTGSAAAVNADATASFTALASGTYYARVSSDVASEYTLSIVRGATLDFEPNNDEPYGATPVSGTILGTLGGFVSPAPNGGAEVEPNDAVATGTDIRGAFSLQGPNSLYAIATGSIASFSDRDLFRIHAGPGDSFRLIRGGSGSGGHSVAILNASGGTLAGATSGSFSTIALLDYILPENAYTGDYYISATHQSTIRTGPYSITIEQQTANRYRAPDRDLYAIALAEGQPLTLTTFTPGDGPDEPTNLADPVLELLGPNGALVASDDNGAGGRNARLTFTAPVGGAGTYRVRVTPASAAAVGDYVLVIGDGTNDSLEVFGVSPADGDFVTAFPATIRVALSQAVDSATVAATDLTINSVPADAVRIIDHSTLEFDFNNTTQPDGDYTIALAAGAIATTTGVPLAAHESHFTLDTVHPTVVTSSVQNGAVVASGDVTFTFAMSEPLARLGLGIEDVTLVEQFVSGATFAPTSVRFNEAADTLEVAYTALPEGQFVLTLLAGSESIRDRAGLPLDGTGSGTQAANYTVSFTVDATTSPFTAPLVSVAPSGSWIQSGTLAGLLHAEGDVDRFTIELDAIERIAVLATPLDAALQARVRIFAPSGTLLGDATATAPGNLVNLPSAANVGPGSYTVEVAALAGAGRYDLRVVSGANVERETTTGRNDTPLAAEELSSSAIVLGPGVSRMAVLGTANDAADIYRFTAAAQDRLSITLAPSNGSLAPFANGRLLFQYQEPPQEASPPAPGAPSASPPFDFGGSRPIAVAVADLDADGRAEMFVGDSAGVLTVLSVGANGDLSVRQQIAITQGEDITALVVGDIDQDGDLDVAAGANAGGYYYVDGRTVYVLLGDGSSLGAATDKGTIAGRQAKWLLADLDGQHGLDLIAGKLQETTLATRLRQADGSFAAEQTTDTTGKLVDLVVGDIDADGDLDLAALTYTGNRGYYSNNVESFVEVLLSNGDGTLAPASMTPGHDIDTAIVAGDLDGDDDADVAVVGCTRNGFAPICDPFQASSVAIFRSNGDGSLLRTADAVPSFTGRTLALGDVDGDSDLDLFVAGSDKRNFATAQHFVGSVFYNRGDGSVVDRATVPLTHESAFAALADMDGDGVLDYIGGPANERFFDANTPLTFAAGLGSPQLELLDAAGNVITRGTTVGGKIVIDDFAPSAAGDYFARVRAHGAVEYSLLVYQNATLEREPNQSHSDPQDISRTGTVTGHLTGLEPAGSGFGGAVRVGLIGFSQASLDLYDLLAAQSAFPFEVEIINDANSLASANALSRYDVIVIPEHWSGDDTADSAAALRAWVEAGGGLITTDITTDNFNEFSPGIADFNAIIPVDAAGQDTTGAVLFAEVHTPAHAVMNGRQFIDSLNDVGRFPRNQALDPGAIALASGFVSGAGLRPVIVDAAMGLGRSMWIGLDYGISGPSQPILERIWQRAVAYVAGGGSDEYTFDISGGETLILSTITPGGETRSTNTLDPRIEVYNALGFLVAADDNSAGDGRNALVVHQVAPDETGTYRVVVHRASGEGDYGLSINGMTIAPSATPSVTSTYPTNAARLSGPPVFVDIELSDAIRLDALDASDLVIDGGATVVGVTLIDGRTARFALDAPNNAGIFNYTLSAGALTDLQGQANAAYSSAFEIDRTGPRVIAQTPAVQAAEPFNTFTLTFDEPIAPGTYERSIFKSFERPDGGNMLFSLDRITAAGNTLVVEFFDQTQLGTYTFVLDAAALRDVAGNPLDQNQNGTGGEPADDYTGTITIQSMDLVVEAFAPAASTAAFGATLSVSWTVRNIGGDPAVEGWIDRVWLSSDDTLNPQHDIKLGDFPASDILPLAPNGTYSRTVNVTLPLSTTLVPGTYHLFVETDAARSQAELLENNNTATKSIDLALPPLADLVISDIVLPATTFSNQNIEISWTVTNSGTAPATGTWTDQVFLSADAAAGDDQFFGAFAFTGTLAPGQSIVRTQSIFIPFNLTGDRFAIVLGDATNTIFEHAQDANNTTVSTESIAIAQSLFPDLRTENVTASLAEVELNTQPFTVNWVVRNSGSTATSAPFWTDYVYLSADTTLDPSDRLIGQSNNQSFLAVGDAYGNSAVVTATGLPAGEYFVLVKADGTNPGRVEEFIAEGNNVGIGPRIRVNLPPPPDLIVTSVVAPPLALSGQPVSVTYSVENVGPGVVHAASWTDRVYLSGDLIFDANDTLLASFGRSRDSSIGPAPVEDVEYTATVNVTLPIGVAGTRYILVQTDATNRVNEFAFEQNNFRFDESPLEIALTPPPALIVESIEVPATAEAGRNITVSYTAANRGATDVPNGSWRDSLYLSLDESLGGNDIHLRDVYIYASGLAVDATYNREIALTLPNGLSGEYFLLVASDRLDQVFEIDNANNIVASAAPVAIDIVAPDLVVSSLTANPTAFAGEALNVTWTVTNQGAGDTIGSYWVDRIYLSTDNISNNGDERLLDSIGHVGKLDASGTYTFSRTVAIPFDVSGDWFLYVHTDEGFGGGAIAEFAGESNNAATLSPATITRKTPDLEITATSLVPENGRLRVAWTVANVGQNATNQSYWYDAVVASNNDIYGDADDVLLRTEYRGGRLNPTQEYAVNRLVNVPFELTGTQRIFVVADHENQYIDEGGAEANNVLLAGVIDVDALRTHYDFVIADVDAPDEAVSGQFIELSWTVRNIGDPLNVEGPRPIEAGSGVWTDNVYLSRDQVFDPATDTFLGQASTGIASLVEVEGGAATYEEYARTATLRIPAGLTGPFYLFVRTDRGNQIIELGGEVNGEGNNDAYDAEPVFVSLAPPVDLVAGEITVPPTASLGAALNLTFTIHNDGDTDATGSWTDRLYLSTDPAYSPDDIRLSTRGHSPFRLPTPDAPIPAGGSETFDYSTILPPVLPGQYYLVLRTDIFNVVPESNETNNLSLSLDRVSIDVPEIEIDAGIGTQLFDLTLFNQQSQVFYYRFDALDGQTLSLDAEFIDIADESVFDPDIGQFVLRPVPRQTVTSAYLAFGRVPTPFDYDLRQDDLLRTFEHFHSEDSLIVPRTRAGTYYLRVEVRDTHLRNFFNPFDRFLGSEEKFNLDITVLPFQISSVEGNVLGNAGSATTTVVASNFTACTAVDLLSNGQTVRTAERVERLGNDRALVTFDYAGLPAGEYEIRVTDHTGATDTQTISIIEGAGARPGGSIAGPSPLRRSSEYTFYAAYGNSGDADSVAPLLLLENIGQNPWGLSRESQLEQPTLQALGISLEGPAGVLRPGELGSVPVYFTTTSSTAGASPSRFRVHTITADDPRPLIFDEIEATVRPATIADDDWNEIRPRLVERLGPTWGTYVRALAEAASSLSAVGIRTFDVRTIFDELYRQVAEPSNIAIAGAVVSHSTCGPISGATITAIDAAGNRFVAAANDVGSFTINDAPAGTYSLFADAPGYARTFVGSAVAGSSATEIDIPMSPESLVRGTLELPPGGPTGGVVLVSAVSLAALDDLAQRYSAQSDGTSASFALGGLPAGEYALEVRKAGYVPYRTTVTLAAAENLDLGSVDVAPFATISGRVVSESTDFAASTALVGAFLDDVRVQSSPVDADGFFTMEDLPAGDYEVRVFNAGRNFSNLAAISLDDGETLPNVNIIVHAGAVITGSVTSATTGDPLPDVSVFLWNGDGLRFTTLTDELGNYRVEHVGLETYTVALANGTSTNSAVIDVTQIDGEEYSANLQHTAAGTLTGLVTDSAGQPFIGATVSLEQAGEFIISGRTDESGRYRFLLSAPGTFDLSAAIDGASFARVSGVNVAATQTFEQPIQSGAGSVVVHVDFATPGATVLLHSLLNPNSPVLAGSATMDATGEVRFENLAAGTYRAEVIGSEARGGSAVVAVVNGSTANVTVPMTLRVKLEGDVTDAEGTPLGGATVLLRSIADPTRQSIVTADAAGRYRFASVARGDYDVIVLARGYETKIAPNVTLSFVTQEIDATLTDSSTQITGRVVDAASNAIPGGEVQIFDAAGRLLDQIAVGPDGSFVATGAVGSNLQVEVRHAGFAPSSLGPISAAIGSTTPVGNVALTAVAIAQGFGQQGVPASSPRASASPAAPPLPAASLASYPGFLGSILEIMNGQFNRAESAEIQVDDIPDLPSGCTACGSKLHQALVAQEAQGIFADIAEDLDGDVQAQKLIVGGLFVAEIAVAAGALASLVIAVEGLIAASSYAAVSAAVTAEASASATVGIATGTSAVAAPSTLIIVQNVLSLGVSVTKIYDAIAAVWSSPDTPTADATLTQANAAYQEAVGIVGNLQAIFPALIEAAGAGVSAAGSIAGMIGLIDTIISSFGMTQTSAAVDHLLDLEADLADAANTYQQRIVIALQKLTAYQLCIQDANNDGACDGPGGSGSGNGNGPGNPPPPSPSDPPLPPPPPTPPGDYEPVFVQSVDPNDILGPLGFGEEKWVTLRDPLAYTIRFENQADATAPAMLVTITQQLDDDLDYRTFRVDDFGFGDTRVELSASQPFFQGRVPVGEGSPYVVDVIAIVDIITGLVTWIFQTLDPATGEPPVDALAGFLPPNDPSRRGEGFVSYTIRPKQTAATGSRVDAEATIVFDDNEPIDTPRIFNTLDASAPASSVDAVSNPSGEESFTVRWTAGDDAGGSALAAVDVYVSRDGRPFEPWLLATSLSEATYVGAAGHSYAFYSVARDNAGNAETLPTTADTTTPIPFPGLFGDLNGDGAVGIVDLIRLRNNLGLSGMAAHDDGDLTGDRNVTREDLAAFLGVFGSRSAGGPSPAAADAIVSASQHAQSADSPVLAASRRPTRKAANTDVADAAITSLFDDAQSERQAGTRRRLSFASSRSGSRTIARKLDAN